MPHPDASSKDTFAQMNLEQILRIPRKDSNDDFVLVNTASDRLAPLDLSMLATEGEYS